MQLFGKSWEIPLSVVVLKDRGIEQNQVKAYEDFSTNLQEVLRAAEQAIFKLAHGKTTIPEAVHFPSARPKPTFGVLFQSGVDEEHGLAAKFENGKLTKVGPQDIVL